MRIAVLVYGRLNKCAEHYENVKKHIGKNNDIDFFLSSDNSESYLLEDFIRLYKPILYTNEKITHNYDLGKYKNQHNTSYDNMTRHFINKNRVFLLLEEHIKQNNIEYDVVVSLRIDLLFATSFYFAEILENTIYIPTGNDYVDNGVNDQVAYGKIDVMKKYNSIIVYAVDYLEQNLTQSHPESLTYTNLRAHKIDIKRFNIRYNIIR